MKQFTSLKFDVTGECPEQMSTGSGITRSSFYFPLKVSWRRRDKKCVNSYKVETGTRRREGVSAYIRLSALVLIRCELSVRRT
jgi:hypothetical protein